MIDAARNYDDPGLAIERMVVAGSLVESPHQPRPSGLIRAFLAVMGAAGVVYLALLAGGVT